MISVKTSVQAVDPACGIWLIGKVLEERADAFKIRWANYRVTDWVSKEKTRLPVPKRQCRLESENWKETQPQFYQKGEEVTIKKADGTSGEVVTVEENDPFNCVIYAKSRKLKYEWLMEMNLVESTDRRQPLVMIVNQGEGSTNRSSTVIHRDVVNHQRDQENETPRRRPAQPKRATSSKAPSTTKKTRTLVPKKIATRIAIGPAAPGDDGGPPQAEGMAYGCADAATMAIQSVVSSATAEGNPLPLPDEWSRATPAFGCSAVCDGRFAELTMKILAQSEELAELRKRVDEMERKQGSIQQAPTSSPMPVPATPPPIELSSAVGNALLTLSSSPAPAPTPLQEQDSPIHVLLAKCCQDRRQMAKLLAVQYFTAEERLHGNTSGKRGKTQLDQHRLQKIRQSIFDFAPLPTHQAEEAEWARLKTTIDLFNRHYRQQLREKANKTVHNLI
ncbi:uncharacterized protein [Apostichopus japonicus]|uniref:uncharacterized protein n=1 Tax=Stichopus japonicus TaxID=307972 RepID=UPI003AB6EE3E